MGAEKSAAGKVKPPQHKILQTMGKLRAANIEVPTRLQVQQFSGNIKTKAGFEKNLGILKKQGYVDYPDGKTAVLTQQGIDYVGKVDPSSLTNESVQEDIKELVGGPKAQEIFDALLDGRIHNRKKIAKQLGYDMNKLSGYDKNISKMKTLGFIEYSDKESMSLTDQCFPKGRPDGN